MFAVDCVCVVVVAVAVGRRVSISLFAIRFLLITESIQQNSSLFSRAENVIIIIIITAADEK